MNELMRIFQALWDIFSVFNGNPDLVSYNNNFGIRFGIGMFFSFMLFMIIKFRALVTMKRHHVVAMIGAVLIFIRYAVMFGFEWGFQIGLYHDPVVHFLFPPIEHFFYMLGFGCLAYYSLHHYKYYPGLLKRILIGIPIFIGMFFIYTTMEWKEFFLTRLPHVSTYKECFVDWQSHLLFSIMSFYILVVAIFKFAKDNHYISMFWTVTFIEHLSRTICFYNGYEPAWLATIFHAMQLWALPLIMLHFVKAYVVKLGYCELCKRYVKLPPT